MSLTVTPNFHDPERSFVRDFSPGDDFYQALIDAHRDLSDEQSALLNAKLILVLANQVGDLRLVRGALAIAREGV